MLESDDLMFVSVDAFFEARRILCSCGSNVCDFFFVPCFHFCNAVREGGVVGLFRGQLASDLPDHPLLSFQLLEGLLELCL